MDTSATRCATRQSADAGPGDPRAGDRRSAFAKLDPRTDDPQPGDVRGRDRRRAHHASSSCATLQPAARHLGFTFQIILWLWITVLFANFAEAVAEGRGKAQAATLRRRAPRRWPSGCIARQRARTDRRSPRRDLKQGDIVLVEAGDLIPSDGEVIEGIASVDEFAITGEFGAGHPRKRRRPLGRHRRHARAVRLDQGAHHRGAGLDLPRPHDRAGRRRASGRRRRTRSR